LTPISLSYTLASIYKETRVMGFRKGTLSVARFSAVQENLDLNSVEEKLKSRAFSDFFPTEAKEKWGWTLIDDPVSTDFTYPRYRFGPYLIFSLRVDERRIPASLLKLRCLEQERQFLAEHGLARLSREQRQTIREVAARELAMRIPPVPSFYEVCWSYEKALVYFTGTGQKMRDDFASYFEDTFEIPLSPYPAVENPPMNREFLTWLWKKAEEREGTVALSRQREIQVEFLKRVLLEAGEGEYTESILCQGAHAGFAEVKEAMRQGKKIKEARLNIKEDLEEWEFTFKADDFIVQGLRLPVKPSDEGAEEGEKGAASILERVFLTERGMALVDDLFTLFRKEYQG